MSTLSFPGKNTLGIWERLNVPGERLNIRFVLCFCNSRSQISSESSEPHSFKINEKNQVWKILAGKRLGFKQVIEEEFILAAACGSCLALSLAGTEIHEMRSHTTLDK